MESLINTVKKIVVYLTFTMMDIKLILIQDNSNAHKHAVMEIFVMIKIIVIGYLKVILVVILVLMVKVHTVLLMKKIIQYVMTIKYVIVVPKNVF